MDIEKRIDRIMNLDDMAGLFFDIAKSIGHPIKNLNIELTESWGEQTKHNHRLEPKHNKNLNQDFRCNSELCEANYHNVCLAKMRRKDCESKS